jgi:ribosomal-protein-alanine N-acetyltransferase
MNKKTENSIPVIKTNRLSLRPFEMSDVNTLHRILSDGDILQYFPDPKAPSKTRVKSIIEKQLDHWGVHGFGWWAVEPLNWHEMIGWCGLRYLDETDEVEVAYLLGRNYWRQGLATEAARASLNFGFDELKLEKIIAIVHPENLASRRVLEKLGMGNAEYRKYFGMDCVRYYITKENYFK